MATSKLLQIPKITKIVGSTIFVAHPDISKYPKTTAAAPLTAAGATLTVLDNQGMSNGDYLLLGRVGDNQTEEVAIGGAVTRGQSLTIATTTGFNHELDATVTKILERGIKIYGATTDGGAGTLIASIDAITTPIADAVMIQWGKPETQYTMVSTDTTYAYYFAKFSDGTTDSSASEYVPSTGLTHTEIETLVQRALDITDTELDQKITREMCVDWAQECQDAICQFVYQDPVNGRYIQKDWSFEVFSDETIPLVAGEDKYSLATLGLKFPNFDKSIIDVTIGTDRPLRKIRMEDWDVVRKGKARTELSADATSGATSITVISTANFAASGSLNVGADTITYTAKTATTFTGIPAVGTGSITATTTSGHAVTQYISRGKIARYAFENGNLWFDTIPQSTDVGKLIRIRGFKALSRISDVSDSTTVTFTNVFPLYIGSRIETRKDNKDSATSLMEEWEGKVKQNALADRVPLTDNYRYANFEDPIYGVSNTYAVPDYYYNYNY